MFNEAVGGKLRFDETGMIFSSHRFNVQRGETRIDYADIVGVRRARNLWVIPNGVVVTTREGKSYRFVVYRARKLTEFLAEKAGLRTA